MSHEGPSIQAYIAPEEEVRDCAAEISTAGPNNVKDRDTARHMAVNKRTSSTGYSGYGPDSRPALGKTKYATVSDPDSDFESAVSAVEKSRTPGGVG
jgi:hypothetical protein